MTTISFEEHQEFGRICRIMNNRLVDMVCDRIRFPTKKAMHSSHESKSLKLLTELRSRMEEIMFKDHLDLSTTKIYYGGLPDE